MRLPPRAATFARSGLSARISAADLEDGEEVLAGADFLRLGAERVGQRRRGVDRLGHVGREIHLQPAVGEALHREAAGLRVEADLGAVEAEMGVEGMARWPAWRGRRGAPRRRA